MSLKSQSLRTLSAYARAEAHLVERTSVGALITVIGAVLAAVLFFNECNVLLSPQRIEQMGVDVARSNNLHIRIDMTFPALPCHALSVDIADMATGVRNAAVQRHEANNNLAQRGKIHKWRTDRNGGRLGGHEYIRPQAQGGFFIGSLTDFQDPQALSQALKDKEGCHIEGWLEVQRVAGNFHVSVSQEDFFMLPETQAEMAAALKKAHTNADPRNPVFLDITPDTSRINVSHTIQHISFGESDYPGQVHPLDGYERITDKGAGTWKYFLKVVPTTYTSAWGRRIHTNQFSVNEYYSPISKGHGQMPAVFLIYDLSPITVTVTDQRRSLFHFLVRICAVVGGVFAVSRMVDRFVHNIMTALHPPPKRLRVSLHG